MGVVKRLVCLANSRKHGDRCIAGKELVDGCVAGWVRPVSVDPNEGVSRQYEDGSDPRVMDIVDIPLLKPEPDDHQRENWLLDPEGSWIKTGRVKWADLGRYADLPEPLWVSGSSTYHGRLDRIDFDAASALTSSLRLIHVENLTLTVFASGDIKCRFRHSRTDYRLKVTDPGYKQAYRERLGDHDLGESFLTVSLTRPHKDYCYKVVAAIIERAQIQDEEHAKSKDEEWVKVQKNEERTMAQDESSAVAAPTHPLGWPGIGIQGDDCGAVFTVGHSNHPSEIFLDLLRKHDISAIADVRSAPYSRYCPQFNREALEHCLKEHGIKYVFLGRELGARSDDPSCYANGRIRYSRLAERKTFGAGIQRLKKGAEKHRIAIMCAEREPLECHRTLLVSRALDHEGLSIKHIHPDGHLERHRDAMERLLDIVGLPRKDMFRSKEELIADAFSRQEERVAYTDKSLAAGETGQAP